MRRAGSTRAGVRIYFERLMRCGAQYYYVERGWIEPMLLHRVLVRDTHMWGGNGAVGMEDEIFINIIKPGSSYTSTSKHADDDADAAR